MMRFSFIFCFLLLLGGAVQAQDYAYLNFGNLLASMPESAVADDSLTAYQAKLEADLVAMANKFEKRYKEIEALAATTAPVKMREYEAELQKLQQGALQFEQAIPNKLQAKRQELLGPIVERARKAIDEVAVERNVKMVFDGSIFNALLYTQEVNDLLPSVKEKLGIE
jgi:outer membrane protein